MSGPPAALHAKPTSTLPADYLSHVEEVTLQYAALAVGQPVRLSKTTSNLFRPRARSTSPGLDLAAFTGVISVDPEGQTADVGGMTTYEQLVDGLLPYGLMPLVVPELKTITLGGAITGLGIESSSFRNGMPHESVLEIDVLTGSGDVITASRDNEHSDLFFGFPNSYGTLGYVLRARIELEKVSPYVHLRHLGFSGVDRLVEALNDVCRTHVYNGQQVDFVDGTVFSASECYLTLGSWASDAPGTSDYTHSEIYYRSVQQRSEDWLTVRDYLWRWDTDWFWCSRAFMVQRPWVRRLVGPKFLRSDVYWKIMAFESRHRWKSRLDSARGLPARENVVQDVEVPVDRVEEFVHNFQREVPISPIWLCPIRQRDREATWELYRLDPGELYVNIGFWSTVPLQPGMDPDHHNRWVEQEVDRLGGRKSLYSTAFYDESHFWELYNGSAYRVLKGRYDPEGRLLDLYAKCVHAR